MTPSLLVDRFDNWPAAWGAWMWDMSWQVALIVAVIAALTWLLRRRSAVMLHSLWLLVLVRLVLPPSLAAPTGWGWWCLPAQSSNSAPTTIVNQSTHGQTAFVAPGSGLERSIEDVAENPPHRAAPTGAAPTGAAWETAAASEPANRASAPATTTRWAAYLMLAWLGVTGTLLALLAAGTFRVWNWVLHAEPIDDVNLYRLVESCRRQLGIRDPIELRNSDSCTTPVVVGVLRPVILLPKAVLTNLTTEQLRAVLLHELVHVTRKDAFVNLAQGVLGALYFFHPLVWWANARIRELREEACDELTVAALGGERKVYGEALVKVTELFGYASPPLALGVMESKNPARRRLSRILDSRLPSGGRLGWHRLAAVCALGAVILPGAGAYSPENPAVIAGTSPADKPRSVIDNPPGSISSTPAQDVAAVGDASPQGLAATGGDAPKPIADEARAAEVSLRYRWQANRSYAYAVQIEADLGDEIETLTGTPTYHVRNNHSESTQLVFSGRMGSVRKPKQTESFRLRPPHIGSPFSRFGALGIGSFPGEDVLTINDRGIPQSECGDSQLPYLLGNLSQLAIDTLPESGRTEWETTNKTSITLLSEDNRPLRPRLGPFARHTEGERIDAVETINYRLEGAADSIATIVKTTSLATTQSFDGKPRVELSGESRIAFDLEQGRPQAIDGKLQLTHNSATATQRIPIRITIRQAPVPTPDAAAQPALAPVAGFGLPDDEVTPPRQSLDRNEGNP